MLRTLTQGLHSLFFPSVCLGCQQPVNDPRDLPLCLGCAGQLPYNRPPWCAVCGYSLAGTGAGVDRCRDCLAREPSFSFDRVVTAFLYEGAVRQLVWMLKYQGRLSLVPALAGSMAEAVRTRMGAGRLDLCVPVPLHSTRMRERSFNQAERLGRSLAQQLGLPFQANLLVRKRATLPQIDLPRQMRQHNLEEAFKVNFFSSLQEAKILLVDDIFTTGSTVEACARALKQAGAAEITVAAIAHG